MENKGESYSQPTEVNDNGMQSLSEMPSWDEHVESLNTAKNSNDIPSPSETDLINISKSPYEKMTEEERIEKLKTEMEILDVDVKKELDNVKSILNGRAGAESIMNGIQLDIMLGKYRDARINIVDGSIKTGDEAEKERRYELSRYDEDFFSHLRKSNNRFEYANYCKNEREKGFKNAEHIGREIVNEISVTTSMFNSATYAYGDANYQSGVDGRNEVAIDLGNRISRNLEKGYYNDAKIIDKEIKVGIFWPEEQAEAHRKRAVVEHMEASKNTESSERVSKFEENYDKLKETNPEVFDALVKLSERIMTVAGNDVEGYHAIDMLQGCIADGMYEDAYVDNEGFIVENNPEEILNWYEDDELSNSKEEIMNAYNKKSSELTIDEAKTIITSPLGFRYFRKNGNNKNDTLDLVLQDKDFIIENHSDLLPIWGGEEDYAKIHEILNEEFGN